MPEKPLPRSPFVNIIVPLHMFRPINVVGKVRDNVIKFVLGALKDGGIGGVVERNLVFCPQPHADVPDLTIDLTDEPKDDPLKVALIKGINDILNPPPAAAKKTKVKKGAGASAQT